MQIAKLFFIIITGAAIAGSASAESTSTESKGVMRCATQPGGCPPRLQPTHGIKRKWACTGKCDIPIRQASAKCSAQANAAAVYKSHERKLIWQDCLAGEGYTIVKFKCVLADDPDCWY